MEIEIINEIQRILAAANQDVIEMPMIVSLGDQSSGKSSVIERIMGRDVLPKGSGIVTKRPLILQMTKSTDPQETFRFAHNSKTYTDSTEVMKEIVADTKRICDKTPSGISPIPINLTFYSPNVINLTLVDLPGLTKIATIGQDDSIVENIFQMVKSFVEKENTLILAVIPANNDIANSGALSMIKRVDPEGKRSIACITKIDLMDQGTDCLSILKNEQYRLEKGYIGLVNRNQQQIKTNLSYEESLRLETEFFRNHPVYSEIAHKCGTVYLREYLSEQLVKHIRSCSKSLSVKLNNKQREISTTVFDLKNRLQEISSTNSTSYQLKSLSKLVKPLLSMNNPDVNNELSLIGKNTANITKCHQIILKEYYEKAMEVAIPSPQIIESRNDELSTSMFESAFLIAGAIANQQALNLDSIHDGFIDKYIDAYEQTLYEYFESIENDEQSRFLKNHVITKCFDIRQNSKDLCKDILKTFQYGFLPKIAENDPIVSASVPQPLTTQNNTPVSIECYVSRKKASKDSKKLKLTVKYQSISTEKEEILKPSVYAIKVDNIIANKNKESFIITIYDYMNPDSLLLTLHCTSALEQQKFTNILIAQGFLDRTTKLSKIIRDYEENSQFIRIIKEKGTNHALKHLRLFVEVFLIISEQIKSIIFTIGKILSTSVMKEMYFYLSGEIYAEIVVDFTENTEYEAAKKKAQVELEEATKMQSMYKKIILKMKEIA